MDEIINMLMGKDYPILASLLMGLVVSISPCTLAANISAVSCFTKAGADGSVPAKKLFLRGVVYTLGRTVAYTLLGVVLFYFTSGIGFGQRVQEMLGAVTGPLFILIGLVMLDVIHIHGFADKCVTRFSLSKPDLSFRGAFLFGFVLAFAFCSNCAVVYFGLMVPLSLSLPYGAVLPLLFAVGAAVPVLYMSWILAYSVSSLSKWYDKFSKFELWGRRALGLLFVISGLLFVFEYFLE